MEFDYDLITLGAGSGGVSASRRAAEYGAKVAIAERDLVGGTCVIRGCVPKKLMVYASHFSHHYTDAEGYGWSPVEPQFNWNKLTEAVRNEVMRLNGIYLKMLDNGGVDLLKGDAKLVDPHTVQVGDRKVTGRYILIAVGGEAFKPDNEGMEYAVTSREMFDLPEFPKRFAVIGGGYIGVEFAGILNGLGAEVTQIIRRDRVLNGFDGDLRTDIQEGMKKHGIRLINNIDDKSLKIAKTDDGLKVTFNVGDKEETVTADTVLAATGRKPNLDGLGLDAAGVETAGGAIAVKADSNTSQPHIYAVGDCTDRLNLTPVAIAEGRAFADTIFGHLPRYPSHKNVPSAVFSQPEGATVGMTEEEAVSALGENGIFIYRARFRPMFQTLAGGEDKVTVKLVVDRTTQRVLGVHMVGKDAAEIIQGMAIAVKMGATKADFDATVGIHPSTAEEFVTLRKPSN